MIQRRYGAVPKSSIIDRRSSINDPQLPNQLQRFAEHPQDTFFARQRAHLVRREPTDVVRLIARVNRLLAVGDEQKADVVVLVSVFDEATLVIVTSRNEMNVHIEGQQRAADGHKVEGIHARFLSRLAEGDLVYLPLAIRVTAELQPTIQLAMVSQQRPASVCREYPGGARDVSGTTRAIKAIRVTLY
jgi:hypothetical protein